MDVEFKWKRARYKNVRIQLQTMDRRALGNLMTRSLNDVVTGRCCFWLQVPVNPADGGTKVSL